MAKIDRKKSALVHLAKSRLGMTDQEYREVLAEYADAASASDLTDEGFDRLMAYFRTRGFVSDARRTMVSNRTDRGLASQAQVDLIVALWREVAPDPSIRKLEQWIERFHGVSALRFLTAAKVAKVIASLRSWKRRADEGPRRKTTD